MCEVPLYGVLVERVVLNKAVLKYLPVATTVLVFQVALDRGASLIRRPPPPRTLQKGCA